MSEPQSDTHTRCCNRIHTLLTGRYPVSRPWSPNCLPFSCMAVWEDRSLSKWQLQKRDVCLIPKSSHIYTFRCLLSSVDTGSSGNCASDYRSWTKLFVCNSGIQILFWAFKKKETISFNKTEGKACWRHMSNLHNNTPSKQLEAFEPKFDLYGNTKKVGRSHDANTGCVKCQLWKMFKKFYFSQLYNSELKTL